MLNDPFHTTKGQIHHDPVLGIDEFQITQSVKDALELNKKLQANLRERLNQVEEALEKNTRHIKFVRSLVIGFSSVKKHLSNNKSRVGQNYFIDQDGQLPDPNDDQKSAEKTCSKFKVAYNCGPWSSEEKSLLHQEVIREFTRLKDSLNIPSSKDTSNYTINSNPLNQSENSVTSESDDRSASSSQKDLILETVSQKYNSTIQSKMGYLMRWINWERVADQISTRSATECKNLFLSLTEFGSNTEPFSKEEIEKLKTVIESHPDHDWIAIAREHANRRTPFACFKVALSSILKVHVGHAWTREEDNQLVRLVEKFGLGKWAMIAREIPGRNSGQCLHRYMKKHAPGTKKGRWDKAENQRLLEAVELFGRGNWSKIAQHVVSRTDAQCRERYENVLAPEKIRDPFTKEDISKLIELVKEHGQGNWSRIAECFGGVRTDSKLRLEFKKLVKMSKNNEGPLVGQSWVKDMPMKVYPKEPQPKPKTNKRKINPETSTKPKTTSKPKKQKRKKSNLAPETIETVDENLTTQNQPHNEQLESVATNIPKSSIIPGDFSNHPNPFPFPPPLIPLPHMLHTHVIRPISLNMSSNTATRTVNIPLKQHHSEKVTSPTKKKPCLKCSED